MFMRLHFSSSGQALPIFKMEVEIPERNVFRGGMVVHIDIHFLFPSSDAELKCSVLIPSSSTIPEQAHYQEKQIRIFSLNKCNPPNSLSSSSVKSQGPLLPFLVINFLCVYSFTYLLILLEWWELPTGKEGLFLVPCNIFEIQVCSRAEKTWIFSY